MATVRKRAKKPAPAVPLDLALPGLLQARVGDAGLRLGEIGRAHV